MIKTHKYGTTIPITACVAGDYEGIKKAIEAFKQCHGQYLMRSLYRGRGRPRTSDYRQYYSWQDLMELEAMDMLAMGFTANYTPAQ